MTEGNYHPIFEPINSPVNAYDYIDGDGDMITVDVVDEDWLAVSILRHGRSAILTSVISEPDDARKMAQSLTAWADKIERKRRGTRS